MRNISFDNPYLLLILIPLLALILVPIFLAIRKENNSKAIMTSMVIHIILAICITLALAGMTYTSVITKTQVYVVADVSYSANRNLDQVDSYINEIQDNLPRNAEMGVVVFGEEYKVLTEMGSEVKSVKDHGFRPAQIDATDISSAINHAISLFDEGVIKRIVVITDGKQTRSDAAGELVAAVENAYKNDIYIDAIFLDNNIPEGVKEVQLTDVEFSPSTYMNHKSVAKLLIQSSYATENVNLEVLMNGTEYHKRTISLDEGFNLVEVELSTLGEGRFDYEFFLRADGDTATNNNKWSISQQVTKAKNVLLVSWDKEDQTKLEELYAKDIANGDLVIHPYIKESVVPCTVEEMCRYDEIILSNFDVREIENYTSFIDAIDKCVSRFGKSLVTMGDLNIQNQTEDIFGELEDMLPVKFGNNDNDSKLFAIVIDCSRSMQNFSRLRIAKQAAVQLLNLLSDNDYVMVVAFYGNVEVLQIPTKATDREDIAELINAYEPKQGTMLGTALDKAGDLMIDYPYDEKQIMLISDGMSHSMESDTPVNVVTKLRENGILTSVIQPAGRKGEETSDSSNGNPTTLKAIAAAGGGKYFPILREEDMLEVMFSDIADDLTNSVVVGDLPVTINSRTDILLNNITSLPNISGYTYGRAKASATTVLTVPFTKSSGSVVDAPLLAHWEYGSGRVYSFTSTFTGSWTSNWTSENSQSLFTNIIDNGTPVERVDAPYDVSVSYDGSKSNIRVSPVTLNPRATTTVTVTDPDGGQVTQQLLFNATGYEYDFVTPKNGFYVVDIEYTYGKDTFRSSTTFNLSYSPEYDMFTVFDPGDLHAAIRNRGTVCENSIPNLENNEDEVATYTIRFVAPLMILSVVLYVIDIIIRKLKISDIKSFFGIKPKRGAGK